MSQDFGIPDPENANLTALGSDRYGVRAITCYILQSGNDAGNDVGVRISSLFVIMIISSAVTYFPVVATRVKRLKIPLYVYLFARYFGAGVIIATAFIHLLDPAYSEIGPQTCVGATGGWYGYSWPPAIALTSAMITFLFDFAAERYVEKKFGFNHAGSIDGSGNVRTGSVDAAMLRYQLDSQGDAHRRSLHAGHQDLHSGDQNDPRDRDHKNAILPASNDAIAPNSQSKQEFDNTRSLSNSDEESLDAEKDRAADTAFKQQIAAFLILEFGVLFHSIIIGLTLATSDPDEFGILYPVLIFHQSFEGLGIGARLSAIPFPRKWKNLPWWLCAGYGLTTPIAIAAGLGVRTTYNSNSYTANVVAGVLDSISAGILMFTGFVELLARDFLFNPDRTNDDKQLTFMVCSVLLGAGIMALIGKWA